ncbi:MAG: S16 family serine protease, partial [Phycisphaerae bacterium]
SQHGLSEEQLQFEDAALLKIISGYTREAGVRNLEREIAVVCRSVAAQVARGVHKPVRVTAEHLARYLGPERFVPEAAERAGLPGVARGLAFTPAGGQIIFVEATRMPGKGALSLTGQLGDVMRESAQAAFSLLRSRAQAWGIDQEELAKSDIHIHVPAGAVPKDGPSAGVAMLCALVSLCTKRAVRANVAMTGEITLRGLVLPVGAIKQKVLAAQQAGVDTVILPRGNKKDLSDVPADVRKSMKLVLAGDAEAVLKAALVPAEKARRPGRAARPGGGSARRRRSA